MARDEKYFQNPKIFNPERHWDMIKDKILTEHTDSEDIPATAVRNDDPSNLVFGFGRRWVHVCSPSMFFPFTMSPPYIGSALGVSLRTTCCG